MNMMIIGCNSFHLGNLLLLVLVVVVCCARGKREGSLWLWLY